MYFLFLPDMLELLRNWVFLLQKKNICLNNNLTNQNFVARSRDKILLILFDLSNWQWYHHLVHKEEYEMMFNQENNNKNVHYKLLEMVQQHCHLMVQEFLCAFWENLNIMSINKVKIQTKFLSDQKQFTRFKVA